MMAIENDEFARMRGDWLRAEKAILAQHRAQFSAHSGSGAAILVEKPMDSSADAIRASGTGPFGFKDDRAEHDFERVNPRGSVFQGLYLIVVHVLVLLRLRKPEPPVDSRQVKPKKEAA